MTMTQDDDELVMHDGDGGYHVKCTEIMMNDPEIVLDEPGSALSRTYSYCHTSQALVVISSGATPYAQRHPTPQTQPITS